MDAPAAAAVEQQCASWPAGSLHLERFAPRAMEGPVLQAPSKSS
jgi:hypothetical protein